MPDIETPLRFMRGVGPARAAALAEIGLENVGDVLLHAPRCRGEPPPLIEAGALVAGAEARVKARVVTVRPFFQRGRRGMAVEATLARADGAQLKACFWNAGFLRRHLLPDEWYLFTGRADRADPRLLHHPSFVHLSAGAASAAPVEDACRVLYVLPAGYSQRTIQQLVAECLAHLDLLDDPAGLVDSTQYQRRIRELHRPSSPAAHEQARRCVAARELLALAWTLQQRRAALVAASGRAWSWSDDVQARALARLPFALTPGQTAALVEIRADMRSPRPMYRLLQGDVGSGKTALALVACLAVIADGAQALILAPTALLAEQHHRFCARCLDGSRVRIGLLTGGTAAADRARLVADLADHRVDLVIGTHALLEESVRVADPGLVVIDEQHKFGVAQRAAALAKGAGEHHPDLLLMTATPIPRTLALTAFGDLAISKITGKPPGRGPVRSELRPWRSQQDLDQPIAEMLAAGGGAYVVCPLREESERVKAADAKTVHRHLDQRFPGRVGLLHGALPEAEKIAALARFARGETAVLVATTVVEVGIDLPDATLMAVVHAERFGLAQLHQLRGRIGRGERPGRCLLFHHAGGADRLRILVESDDGTAIAEADLAERGPGQLLGTEQHGLLRLRVADLAKDLDLLQQAHQVARTRIVAGEAMPEGLERFQRWLGAGEALAGG